MQLAIIAYCLHILHKEHENILNCDIIFMMVKHI